MDVFLLYGMGVFDLLVSSLIMCVFVSAEDAMFDEEIYLGINDRDLRGKKGIYSSIVLIICTIGCFVSALYCCIRIARKEAVLRNGIRIPGIKLTEEQRRAILEFIFPGSVSPKSHKVKRFVFAKNTHVFDCISSRKS